MRADPGEYLETMLIVGWGTGKQGHSWLRRNAKSKTLKPGPVIGQGQAAHQGV